MSNTTNTTSTETFEFVLYRYHPNLVAPIIFTVLFFATTFIHAFQLGRSRTWYFIPMVVGGLMEAIGYIGRVMSHFDQESLGPYIMQSLLILISPALFAASIYMILGRLIRVLDAEKHSVIRLNWLTKIFVFGDVFSFVIQGSGGGMMSGGASLDRIHLGEHLILAGLFVQIVFFSVFVCVALVFHMRIVRNPSVRAETMPRGGRAGWMTLLKTLYLASALILVRSVFRVIEYIQGNAGYLLRNEVWLYLFDACLMFIAVALFNFVHPSNVVPGRGKELRPPTMESADLEMTDADTAREDSVRRHRSHRDRSRGDRARRHRH